MKFRGGTTAINRSRGWGLEEVGVIMEELPKETDGRLVRAG